MGDDSSEGFIKHFHHLPGTTIREKQHHLYQLFLRNKNLLPNELDTICEKLKPCNHLERIFRIDFLIYYKRSKELFTEFVRNDEITKRKISKHDWFFCDLFAHITLEEFVNTFLPTVSLSLRAKLLRRLHFDTTAHYDDVFDAVKQRYGIRTGLVLLHKCSDSKITEIIQHDAVAFTGNQLIFIYGRNKQLIELYSNVHETVFFNCRAFTDYLAKNDAAFLLKLSGDDRHLFQFGRRITKRFYKTNESDILAEPQLFFNILNKGALIRKLGPKIEQFSQSLNQTSQTYEALLKCISQSRQMQVYKSIYEKNQVSMDNFAALMPAFVLEHIQDAKERESYTKMKYGNDIKYYMSNFAPESLYELFLEQINNSSADQRAESVNIIANSCVRYKNYEIFGKLAALIAGRLKNDDIAIRQNFLNWSYREALFLDGILDETTWKNVFDIIAGYDLKNGTILRNAYVFQFAYLKVLWNQNKPIEQFLEQLDYSELVWSEFKNYPKLFKTVLLSLIQKSNEDRLLEMRLISQCLEYNQEFPNDRIDILGYGRLKNALFKEIILYGNPSSSLYRSLYLLLMFNGADLTELKQLVLANYLKVSNFDLKLLICLLKSDPELVLNHLHLDLIPSKTQRNIFPDFRRFVRLLKKYEHINLDKKVLGHYMEYLNKFQNINNKSDKTWKFIIYLITDLVPEQDLQKIAINLKPEIYKVDFSDKEIARKYVIQCAVVRNLTKLSPNEASFDLVRTFCEGDYLNSALAPLYSIIYRTPENQVFALLNQVRKTDALSFKKHAIHLSCMIFGPEEVTKMLETEQRIPKLIPVLNYFIRNPSVRLWEVLESELKKIDKKCELLLNDLINKKMPNQFAAQYLKILWGIAGQLENTNEQNHCLEKISAKIVGDFSLEFVNEIISNQLFRMDASTKFAVLRLIHNFSEDLVDNIFKVIIEHKQETKKIRYFFQLLYKVYMELDCKNLKLLQKITSEFGKHFKMSEGFNEYITFKLMTQKDASYGEIVKFIAALHTELIKEYGDFITSPFARTIGGLISPALIKDQRLFKFCLDLLKVEGNINNCLFIILLLPNFRNCEQTEYKEYSDIIEKLKKTENTIIQIELNIYLQNACVQGDIY